MKQLQVVFFARVIHSNQLEKNADGPCAILSQNQLIIHSIWSKWWSKQHELEHV